MSQYAQLDATATQVVAVVDIAPALVVEWVATGNPKAALYRPLVIDTQPVPSATQYVANAGIVIESGQVRQAWALLDKSAEQLEDDAVRAEKQQINTYLADLQTQLDISNAARAALTNVQRINELENDTRVVMRSVKFLLRETKRRL
jgi:hypothetical protein